VHIPRTPVTDGEQTSTIVTGNSQANHFLPAGYKIVYSGDSIESVNLPHGIAADGYRLFWSNGKDGTKGGSVVSGLEEPKGGMAVNKIATNLGAAFGLCLTPQRVFYTDAEANVFSARVHGGPVTSGDMHLASLFVEPWDAHFVFSTFCVFSAMGSIENSFGDMPWTPGQIFRSQP
jgi:hypothetical protein